MVGLPEAVLFVLVISITVVFALRLVLVVHHAITHVLAWRWFLMIHHLRGRVVMDKVPPRGKGTTGLVRPTGMGGRMLLYLLCIHMASCNAAQSADDAISGHQDYSGQGFVRAQVTHGHRMLWTLTHTSALRLGDVVGSFEYIPEDLYYAVIQRGTRDQYGELENVCDTDDDDTTFHERFGVEAPLLFAMIVATLHRSPLHVVGECGVSAEMSCVWI